MKETRQCPLTATSPTVERRFDTTVSLYKNESDHEPMLTWSTRGHYRINLARFAAGVLLIGGALFLTLLTNTVHDTIIEKEKQDNDNED